MTLMVGVYLGEDPLKNVERKYSRIGSAKINLKKKQHSDNDHWVAYKITCTLLPNRGKSKCYMNISGGLNCLHPNFSIHFLKTLLYTFPLVLTRPVIDCSWRRNLGPRFAGIKNSHSPSNQSEVTNAGLFQFSPDSELTLRNASGNISINRGGVPCRTDEWKNQMIIECRNMTKYQMMSPGPTVRFHRSLGNHE